ncbi:tRNA lysidine(34) synthetase TilS [Tissierella sp. Yu-01]|uniref:tRNA lysidine(34) synthetase TilS n=1 Tax=Tissierella sp. Yu-01 TaxID=3035694 RepID=UPI00240E2574|nr:tRNA lysidine(34) synthetase TilS [Tissierella sp. Yu-01]WFA07728.1 tRNA lysidine(34) synthetase TilS [Tissierella sp. Yu-01]
MIKIVRDNIILNNLIEKDENIVIGVSGGPDSMALLYSLIELKDEFKFNIFVAHVNHGVRGDEADADQEFVKNKANELKLPFYSINVDMDGYAKEKGITSEEAGRELRYGYFRKILRDNGGGKIAVAHNKNDQAETLLFRIMRGTGIDGLKGMDFIHGDIIRPLLNVSREKIEDYILENCIESVLDKTNLLPIYSRNKVRLELLPYIQENFNPNIVDVLWRLSRSSKIDSQYLGYITEEKYNLLVKYQSKNSIILDGELFNRESLSMKLRVIRKCIDNILGSLQGISEQHVTSLVELFNINETGKQLNLPNNIIGKVSYLDFIIEKATINKKKDIEYILELGENKFSDIGVSINLSVYSNDFKVNKDKNIRVFDYDKIIGKLKIRNRKDGDKFIPYGMKGTKKLKDYFIDKKVPKDLRDEIPLLIDDENIMWIMGYATNDLYKITKETKKFLVVHYKKI